MRPVYRRRSSSDALNKGGKEPEDRGNPHSTAPPSEPPCPRERISGMFPRKSLYALALSLKQGGAKKRKEKNKKIQKPLTKILLYNIIYIDLLGIVGKKE
jgi:hypothetical protein